MLRPEPPHIKHTEPLAFRISRIVKIANTSRNSGMTKFYNANTTNNYSNSQPKNNFN